MFGNVFERIIQSTSPELRSMISDLLSANEHIGKLLFQQSSFGYFHGSRWRILELRAKSVVVSANREYMDSVNP